MDFRRIDATESSAPGGSRAGDPSSDIDLVARIQSGEQNAEAELYERYGPRVFYLALPRTHSREDAEDLRSETLLRVLSAIRNRQLREPGALARFILRTLDNVVLEAARRESRARLAASQQSDPRTHVHEHFLDDHVKDAIEGTLKGLKPRERDFLRLYYYEELSKEEIALRIGIAGERVRLLKSRALKSFRERFLRGWRKDSDTSGGK